jgi:hypothetical protein
LSRRERRRHHAGTSRFFPVTVTNGAIRAKILTIMAAPGTRNSSEPTNGRLQFPVASTTTPNTTGETIVASAAPVLSMSLVVPAWGGATSIGMTQIGPIVSSSMKNAPDRHNVTRDAC